MPCDDLEKRRPFCASGAGPGGWRARRAAGRTITTASIKPVEIVYVAVRSRRASSYVPCPELMGLETNAPTADGGDGVVLDGVRRA